MQSKPVTYQNVRNCCLLDQSRFLNILLQKRANEARVKAQLLKAQPLLVPAAHILSHSLRRLPHARHYR